MYSSISVPYLFYFSVYKNCLANSVKSLAGNIRSTTHCTFFGKKNQKFFGLSAQHIFI